MKRSKKTFILAAVLVLLLAGAGLLYNKLSQGRSPGLPPVEDSASSSQESSPVPAPSFPLEDPEGNLLDLSDLIGDKPVVLNFWASTCPPCKEEMPDFQAAFEQYGQEIHFVMVNVGDAMQGETREKAEAFLMETGYSFPVYYDIDYQGILIYGVTGFPHTYFIDSQGNLQLYAPGMISAAGLQQGLHSISPDLVPAPES